MKWFAGLGVGFWNMWLYSLFTLAVMYLPLLFLPKNKVTKMAGFPTETIPQKIVFYLFLAVYIAILIYTVWVPVDDGILFIAGNIIFAAALVIWIITFIHFMSAPADKLVTDGMYSVSRNPMFVSESLVFLGMGITGASFPIVTLSVLYAGLAHLITLSEEKVLAERYGKEYGEYCKNVRRYF
jgi:protein-S-isoprenylcysteine O-methyltransferase Ste14